MIGNPSLKSDFSRRKFSVGPTTVASKDLFGIETNTLTRFRRERKNNKEKSSRAIQDARDDEVALSQKTNKSLSDLCPEVERNVLKKYINFTTFAPNLSPLCGGGGLIKFTMSCLLTYPTEEFEKVLMDELTDDTTR